MANGTNIMSDMDIPKRQVYMGKIIDRLEGLIAIHGEDTVRSFLDEAKEVKARREKSNIIEAIIDYLQQKEQLERHDAMPEDIKERLIF